MSYGRGHKISLEECQRRINKVSANIFVVDYYGNRKPSPCICKKCGRVWHEPAKNLFRGSNCPRCFKRRKNNWNTRALIFAVSDIRPDIEIVGEYVNMKVKLKCRCRTCKNEWMSMPGSLLQGNGCPKCAQVANHNATRKTMGQFILEMNDINPSINIIGEYINAKKPLLCSCTVCETKWNAAPTSLLSGSGCPTCGRERIKTSQLKSHDTFLEDMRVVNPDIEVISPYLGAHRQIKLKCRICNEEWECTASNAIAHANGCPMCGSSHGERAINAHLRELGIRYVPQKRFDGLIGVGGTKLSYDFYLPDMHVLIEYQGQFHDGTSKMQTQDALAKQKEHDRRKKDYAIRNGFKFIEIWYYDFKNIKHILEKELINNNIAS